MGQRSLWNQIGTRPASTAPEIPENTSFLLIQHAHDAISARGHTLCGPELAWTAGRTGRKSMEEEKNCGTCIYNEDGFCDRLGRLVEDDDKCNDKCWEGKKE